MPQDKKQRTTAIIFWILVGICMAVIFYFSAKPANVSAGQSEWMLRIIQSIFGDNNLNDFIVRKAAHFSEYAGLCFLTNWAIAATKSKPKLFISTAITSLYAVTDEFHQLFVEGRACKLIDWVIDTSGALTGMVVFLIIYIVIKNLYLKGNKK